MTAVGEAQYERAAQAVLEACRTWAALHPDARLRFQPMVRRGRPGYGKGPAGAIMSLKAARLIHRVAGNSITRRLLESLDRSVKDWDGATVMMAEAAIEKVYGIKQALTVEPPS